MRRHQHKKSVFGALSDYSNKVILFGIVMYRVFLTDPGVDGAVLQTPMIDLLIN